MLAALAALPALPASAAPRLDGVLTDHAVIQRGKPLRISGTAEPGETIRIGIAGQSVSVTADRAGHFAATLAPLAAGGPYEMQLSARSGLTVVRDLLAGDVFLCSGQSNMEMPVERSQDSYSVYAAADDQLRLLTVPKATAFVPQARFGSQPSWASATPATAGPFSAACFYMAQALRKTAKMPIGAIHSSWGGSRISAWMDEPGLRAAGMGDGVEALRLYARDMPAAIARTSAKWEQWWRDQSGDRAGSEPWRTGAVLAWQPVPRIGAFNRWGVPALADYVGMLWFRKQVELTAQQARQEAVLSIGAVDDADVTWVNGKPVGGSSNASTPRSYLLPAGTLIAGRNVISLNDDNVWAEGGMLGPGEAMRLTFADGSSVALDSGWEYAVAGKPRTNAPRAPWDDINGTGTLYNAMIAPLGPIALAGVAWYQGESDTDLPGYDVRLTELMRDWRRQFGLRQLPFAIVQLSAYGDTAWQPRESGWAGLRDTQRRVAERDGHAAIAVTLDLGDPLDIHPGEKREVGRRLARAMRSLAYGEAIAPSGPRVLEARRQPDGTIALSFADVAGALVTRGADRAIGFELCGADRGSCRYADARASGNRLVLVGDGKPVTRVRYAWADSPAVNLFDRDGLPVGGFEIAVP
jgi:sialate O-acetylesterase